MRETISNALFIKLCVPSHSFLLLDFEIVGITDLLGKFGGERKGGEDKRDDCDIVLLGGIDSANSFSCNKLCSTSARGCISWFECTPWSCAYIQGLLEG